MGEGDGGVDGGGGEGQGGVEVGSGRVSSHARSNILLILVRNRFLRILVCSSGSLEVLILMLFVRRDHFGL